jgi:hypothetical protein
MNSIIRSHIIRALFILLLQIILLKRIDINLGGFNYIHFTVYPVILMLLPYKTNKTLLVLMGFLLGLTIDLFYDSPGVHAAAACFTAYIRFYILKILEPAEAYTKDTLTAYSYGYAWFLSYISIMLFLHLFVLYSIEAFSFVYITEILLRSIFSFIASLFLIFLGQLIFNPKA